MNVLLLSHVVRAAGGRAAVAAGARRSFSQAAARRFALAASVATLLVSLVVGERVSCNCRPTAGRGCRRCSRGTACAYHWFTYANAGRRIGRPITPLQFEFLFGLDGISLALIVLTTLLTVSVRADFVGVDSRAGGRVLRVPAAARSRADRRVFRVRPGAVLCVLRVHADAAVLPDRHLGRAAAAVCGDQVLPVHARGQPGDAGRAGGAGARRRRRRALRRPRSMPDLAAWTSRPIRCDQRCRSRCSWRSRPGSW